MSGKTNASKKRPARVAAGPAAPGFARTLGETVSRALGLFLPLVLLFVVYAGISFLLWRPLNGAPNSSDSGQLARLTDKIIRDAVFSKPRPAWIPKQDFEQAANLGLLAREHSVFEPNLSRAMAQAYQTSSWVDRVEYVRLRYPAQMELSIEWRKPVARVDRTSLVLDRNGVVLNLMADNPLVKELPVISGASCARRDAGQRVVEKDVLDGLELISVVRDVFRSTPGNLRVTSVFREASRNWQIVTDRGLVVHWGAFTDDPPMDEPRTHEKAELLRRRLNECKDPSLLEYIKVYHAQAPVKPRGVATVAEPVKPIADKRKSLSP